MGEEKIYLVSLDKAIKLNFSSLNFAQNKMDSTNPLNATFSRSGKFQLRVPPRGARGAFHVHYEISSSRQNLNNYSLQILKDQPFQ